MRDRKGSNKPKKGENGESKGNKVFVTEANQCCHKLRFKSRRLIEGLIRYEKENCQIKRERRREKLPLPLVEKLRNGLGNA